jgi:hypothetical protein
VGLTRILRIGKLIRVKRRIKRMAEQELKDLGEGIGIKAEERGQGRPVGSRGPLPNLKTMNKRDLEREAGRSRKKIRELERKLAESGPERGPETAEGEAGPEVMDEKAVGGFIGWIVNSWVAPRLGHHWRLSEKEIEQAGQECAPFVNKYAPYASRWQEEIRAGFWAIATFAPRWEKTRELQAAEIARREKEGAKPLEETKEPSEQAA